MLLLVLLCSLWVSGTTRMEQAAIDGGGVVVVDSNGDLSVVPLAGRTVIVNGVDVPRALVSVDGRLRALETALRIEPVPAPDPTAGLSATYSAPRIGLDPLGNLLLVPGPSQALMMAGVRVLELLTQADQRLEVVVDRVFGPGVAPNVTSVPPPSTHFLQHPGTVGLDAQGNIQIEPLAGRAVLAAGRDMVLELHRIMGRLNLTERAMASCACLAPPATCRPVFGTGSDEQAAQALCLCNDGWQGRECNENRDECISGTHSCNGTSAACIDTAGSFTCACRPGFTGNGAICANINECATSTHNCSPNATCTDDFLGSFTCLCRAGFTGDGATCVDVNECTGNTHNCNVTGATCTETAGSFLCSCNAGFTGNGIACVDANECTGNTHNCNTDAICTNFIGSFTCVCSTGFTGNGISCNKLCVATDVRMVGGSLPANLSSGNLTCILGSLEISNTSSVASLSRLSSIGGRLNVFDNPTLAHIDGLSGLKSVGNYVYLTSNDNLRHVDALRGLTVLGGLWVISNPRLTQVNGLGNVTRIAAHVFVRNNTMLADTEGLANVTSIGGYLMIHDNPNLANLDGFRRLTTFSNLLSISNNSRFTNLDGLRSLNATSGGVSITSNTNLVNMDGLSNLSSIGSLVIWNNPRLVNVGGLRGLRNITSYVDIRDNKILSNLDGLSNVLRVDGDYLQIASNQGLLGVGFGFQRLLSIRGNLFIGSNPQLSNIASFGVLASIGGSLNIRENALVNANCLPALQCVGSVVALDGCSPASANRLRSLPTCL